MQVLKATGSGVFLCACFDLERALDADRAFAGWIDWNAARLE
ncbi:MAG: hypothetical protein V9E93_09980 [Steroidobacteraceae bacterium]